MLKPPEPKVSIHRTPQILATLDGTAGQHVTSGPTSECGGLILSSHHGPYLATLEAHVIAARWLAPTRSGHNPRSAAHRVVEACVLSRSDAQSSRGTYRIAQFRTISEREDWRGHPAWWHQDCCFWPEFGRIPSAAPPQPYTAQVARRWRERAHLHPECCRLGAVSAEGRTRAPCSSRCESALHERFPSQYRIVDAAVPESGIGSAQACDA